MEGLEKREYTPLSTSEIMIRRIILLKLQYLKVPFGRAWKQKHILVHF